MELLRFKRFRFKRIRKPQCCFDFENVGVPTFCFHEKMNVSGGKRRTHANLVHSKTQIY
ncbi:hypothetical protein LEP1GSC171_2548 [Leptospira santarosai str. HAI1380]|nr:hypothetical protein LEP1GSC171_2548 [Leptospira santarosai str. HAI1380]